MPISNRPWLAQSANEWIASASMAPEPVKTAAANLAVAMPPLAASAYKIARVDPLAMRLPFPVANDVGGVANNRFQESIQSTAVFFFSGLESIILRMTSRFTFLFTYTNSSSR
jgi:hypothetical protein